jgi:ribosome maturation factor RimP
MALQQIVEQTVTGLGYELVEIERLAGGLLRITIDLPYASGSGSGSEPVDPVDPVDSVAPVDQGAPDAVGDAATTRPVTVEDCEKVTRQLLFALEVEAIEYQRLEVSSPGIDRLLRSDRDFERFQGSEVDITLKEAVGAAAQGLVNANRKKFRGTLERAVAVAGAPAGWQLVWSEAPKGKPGQRISKHRAPAPMQVLGFVLDEVREARLAPIVNFKGRGSAAGTVDG